MKRLGVIASLSLGVVGISSFALADRITSLIDDLPMQSADTGFSIPEHHQTIVPAFKTKGSSVHVSTATPFEGEAAASSGAAEALQVVAARNPGVALNLLDEEPFEPVLAFQSTEDSLIRTIASKGAPDEAVSGSEGDDTPKSLATRLFDKDDREWRSGVHADSPLVGAIVSADGTPSDPDSLVKAVKGARYVLLGEIHDNPDHHRLQAGIIRSATENTEDKPAVVFEMIPQTFSSILENLDEQTPVDLGELAKKLSWNERGWPDFSIYAPIFEAALDKGLPIVAGNFDTQTVREMSSEGEDAVPADERARLGLDLPVEAAVRQELMAELKASHCGLLPEAALAPMEFAQRLRDGAMAASMIEAADENGSAILIAGSGHTRTDRGVPAVIAGLTGNDDSIAVQMVEIAGLDQDQVSDYGLTSEAPAPFDFTIFTPKANETDHCAEMEAMMKKRADAAAPSKDAAN